MSMMPISTSKAKQEPEFAVSMDHIERRWYAAYTQSNHEKQVAAELNSRGVEHFLPLYNSVRRWKDRRVRLDLPLFPGYIFVHLAPREQLRVLQIPSVVYLVGFGGKLAALPDEQVEILRRGLAERLRAEPHPFLTVGRRVRVASGPLAGLEGVLRRKKGRFRFVLSVELIQRALSVDVDASEVQPLGASKRSLPGVSILPLGDKSS